MSSSAALRRHSQEFLAGQRVVAKATEHPAGHEIGIRLVYVDNEA
jgi:hypothetical protein